MKEKFYIIKVDNPYTALGLCMVLDNLGFHVNNLYVFDELNINGIFQLLNLNKWIYISLTYKDVTFNYNKPDNNFEVTVFNDINQLVNQLKIDIK